MARLGQSSYRFKSPLFTSRQPAAGSLQHSRPVIIAHPGGQRVACPGIVGNIRQQHGPAAVAGQTLAETDHDKLLRKCPAPVLAPFHAGVKVKREHGNA